jgi:lysyl-tRNA synthetase class I
MMTLDQAYNIKYFNENAKAQWTTTRDLINDYISKCDEQLIIAEAVIKAHTRRHPDSLVCGECGRVNQYVYDADQELYVCKCGSEQLTTIPELSTEE